MIVEVGLERAWAKFRPNVEGPLIRRSSWSSEEERVLGEGEVKVSVEVELGRESL